MKNINTLGENFRKASVGLAKACKEVTESFKKLQENRLPPPKSKYHN